MKLEPASPLRVHSGKDFGDGREFIIVQVFQLEYHQATSVLHKRDNLVQNFARKALLIGKNEYRVAIQLL